MLERRAGDRSANRRIGQRVDRRFGVAGLALAGQFRADVLPAGSPPRAIDPDGRLARVWARMSAGGEIQRRPGRPAWRRPASALHRDVEIGQHAPGAPARRRGAGATTSNVTVETTSSPVSWQLARTLVIAAVTSIAARIGASGRVEQGDVTGRGRNADHRAGAADARCRRFVDVSPVGGRPPSRTRASRAARRSFTWRLPYERGHAGGARS